MSEEQVRKLSELEDLDEKFIETKPWAQQLLASTLKMSKKAVLNWCKIVCHIGEADVDLEAYIEIFVHQVENIYEELISDIEVLQDKRYDNIEQLLQRLQNLCSDLHAEMPTFTYENTSLGELHRKILERVKKLQALADSRKAELKSLNDNQEKLCRRLGRTPNLLQESPLPLPNEIEALRGYIEALENDALEREEKFFQMKEEITEIVAQLGVTPKLDFEKEILNLTNSEVRISDAEMMQLELYHDQVVKQLDTVKEEIQELRQRIDSLWDKLETDIAERDVFRSTTTGNSVATLQALKAEAEKLEEKKKANIQVFIRKQKAELLALWHKCHCTENEQKSFPFLNSECYNEDLFDLYELEIQKWKNYYSTNKEMFTVLEEYKTLWDGFQELEQKSGGTNRYKNRGGQLLAEEKLRNRYRRRIPKCEETLLKLAETYSLQKRQPFRTFGLTIQEYIDKLHRDADTEFKEKLSAKKQQRELSTVAMSCRTNLFPVSPGPPRSCSKRKLLTTPSTAPSKKQKPFSLRKVPHTGLPKLNVSRKRRSAGKTNKRLSFTGSKENRKPDDSGSTSYDEFEKAMASKDNARSTQGPQEHKMQLLAVPTTFNV